MNILLVVSRLLLALIFATAGIAKLVDRDGSRRAIREFGIPESWTNGLGLLLPLIELLLAFALIPLFTAWWGALGTFALLLLFIFGISFNLAQGRKPDCHCFGALYSAPVGWPTLLRNGVLAAVAGIILLQGPGNVGPSVVQWLFALTTLEIVGIVFSIITFGLLVTEAWLLINLWRQNGRLLLRIEALEKIKDTTNGQSLSPKALPMTGLPIGTRAPAFQLSGLYGETVTLDSLRLMGKPVILIFSDPGCGPCNALMPEISRWQTEHNFRLTVALVSRGTIEANRVKRDEHGLTHILLQQDQELAESYRLNGTPSAVVILSDGRIGSVMAEGAVAIRNLVAQTVEALNYIVAPTSPASGNGCGCKDSNINVEKLLADS